MNRSNDNSNDKRGSTATRNPTETQQSGASLDAPGKSGGAAQGASGQAEVTSTQRKGEQSGKGGHGSSASSR